MARRPKGSAAAGFPCCELQGPLRRRPSSPREDAGTCFPRWLHSDKDNLSLTLVAEGPQGVCTPPFSGEARGPGEVLSPSTHHSVADQSRCLPVRTTNTSQRDGPRAPPPPPRASIPWLAAQGPSLDSVPP